MNKYKVYQNLEYATKCYDDHTIAIKNGFSWPGFFFGWIWMIVKEMWMNAIIFFILQFIVVSSVMTVLPTAGFFIALGLCIYIGYKGNNMYENKLLQDDYKFIKEIDKKDVSK